MRWLLALSTVLAAVGGAAARAQSTPRPIGPLPVVVHVAELDGAPVADDAWLADALSLADRHFGPAGVAFAEVDRRALPETYARLENIRDRHRLKRYLVPRAINVFVVDRIRDPVASAATRRAAAAQGFSPTGWLGGAHIRASGRAPETYIVVSRRSDALVVTHELGHFLGAPHSPDPDNIMSYSPARDRFDDRQLRVFRTFARRYLRRGELSRVRAPRGGRS